MDKAAIKPVKSARGGGTAGGVLLFDGECNLCNGVVDLVVRWDRRGAIRFAPLRSSAAADLLEGSGVDASKSESVVFVDGGRVWTRSDAVLAVCGELRAPLRWLRFLRVVPRGVRDAVYRFIARRRFGWFGRRKTCRTPSAEEKDRFLG